MRRIPVSIYYIVASFLLIGTSEAQIVDAGDTVLLEATGPNQCPCAVIVEANNAIVIDYSVLPDAPRVELELGSQTFRIDADFLTSLATATDLCLRGLIFLMGADSMASVKALA